MARLLPKVAPERAAQSLSRVGSWLEHRQGVLNRGLESVEPRFRLPGWQGPARSSEDAVGFVAAGVDKLREIGRERRTHTVMNPGSIGAYERELRQSSRPQLARQVRTDLQQLPISPEERPGVLSWLRMSPEQRQQHIVSTQQQALDSMQGVSPLRKPVSLLQNEWDVGRALPPLYVGGESPSVSPGTDWFSALHEYGHARDYDRERPGSAASWLSSGLQRLGLTSAAKPLSATASTWSREMAANREAIPPLNALRVAGHPNVPTAQQYRQFSNNTQLEGYRMNRLREAIKPQGESVGGTRNPIARMQSVVQNAAVNPNPS